MKMNELGIRLLVENFSTCHDFYVQKLGLEPFWGTREDTFASFKVPGGDKPCLSIFLGRHQGTYKGYEALTGIGRVDQAVYIIPTDDVDADYAILKARGVVFMGEPQTIPEWYMRCVYFRDPEGNLFELCRDSLD